MGANDRDYDRRDEQRKRRTEGRAQGRLEKIRRVREKAGVYDLEQVDWQGLLSFIYRVVEAGGAVRVGRTRDGGALNVAIYFNDDYVNEYIRPGDDVGEVLDAYLTALGLTPKEE